MADVLNFELTADVSAIALFLEEIEPLAATSPLTPEAITELVERATDRAASRIEPREGGGHTVYFDIPEEVKAELRAQISGT